MIHGINTDKTSPKLLPGFKSLFVFLETTCKSDMNPTVVFFYFIFIIIRNIAETHAL